MGERRGTEVIIGQPTDKALEAFKLMANCQLEVIEASGNGTDPQKLSALRKELDQALDTFFAQMTGSERAHFWLLTELTQQLDKQDEDLEKTLRLHGFGQTQISDFLSIRSQLLAQGTRRVAR